MSVLVTVKVRGDLDKFRASLEERAGEFEKVADRAREGGALHHRFGIGDGYVLAVDEWHTPEQFEQFFSDPEMQTFVASIGADTSVPPEITILEALSTPDQF
jgi:hypothetical protein